MQSVAVIGCGPAGLACSIFLARQGKKVTLFEAFDTPRPVGSGLMMQPTGLSVLNELGLLEQIVSRGKKIERIVGRDADSGRPVLDVSYSSLGGKHFGVGVHRHTLFSTLYEAAQTKAVEFKFGQAVTHLVQEPSGVILQTKQDKSFGPYAFAVVADGSGSALAQNTFGLPKQANLPYGAYWATINWPGAEFNEQMLEQRYRGASKMAGLLPIGAVDGLGDGADKAAFFWSLKGDDVANVQRRGLKAWKAEVVDLWPQAHILLEQINSFDDLTFAGYQHSTLRKPWCEKTIFIGDAYHSTSPQLGQGANMALLDAKALDQAVRNCGDDFASLGWRFHAYRRRQISIFQGLSRVLTPFYQSDSHALGFIRDKIVSRLVQIPPAPRLMAAMVSGLFVKPFKTSWLFDENAMELIEPDWQEIVERLGN